MFPVLMMYPGSLSRFRDQMNKVIGFSNRSFIGDSKERKYVNTPTTEVFKKNQVIYGIHKMKSKEDNISIIEGQICVIQMYKHGYTAGGLMGTSSNDTGKVVELGKRTNSLILMLDGDKAGRKSMEKLAVNVLKSTNSYSEIVELPNNHDPDSLLKDRPDHFKQLFESRESYPMYLFKDLLKKYPLNSPKP